MVIVCEVFEGVGFDMKNYYEEVFQIIKLEFLVVVVDYVDGEQLIKVKFVMLGKDGFCVFGYMVFQVVCVVGVCIGVVCEFGFCGICKVMKFLGEVEMDYNGGIFDDEIVEGYIFVCCLCFKGDIEIEVQVMEFN